MSISLKTWCMMIRILKSKMKQSSFFMNFVAKMYNTLHYNNTWGYKSRNRIRYRGAFLKGTSFHITGKGNTIEFGSKSRFFNCSITILGNNCKLIVGGGSTIVSNTEFWLQDDNSTIIIGEDFTMEGGHMAATEGESITVGNDCMFSGDVEIRNGDSHSILNVKTGERLNKALSVMIGNHVWLAAHVRVLKGTVIPSHSIIGNSSVVTSQLEKTNALYSGIPCRLLKENVDWNRYKL